MDPVQISKKVCRQTTFSPLPSSPTPSNTTNTTTTRCTDCVYIWAPSQETRRKVQSGVQQYESHYTHRMQLTQWGYGTPRSAKEYCTNRQDQRIIVRWRLRAHYPIGGEVGSLLLEKDQVDSDSHSNSKGILIKSTHCCLPPKGLQEVGLARRGTLGERRTLHSYGGPRREGDHLLCKGIAGSLALRNGTICTVAIIPGGAVVFLRPSRRSSPRSP